MSTFALRPVDTVSSPAEAGVFVQGVHVPDELVRSSGMWIDTAGSAMLLKQEYAFIAMETPLWLVVEEGSVTFSCPSSEIELKKDECVVVPAEASGCMLKKAREARLLWFSIAGGLTDSLMEKMNVSTLRPVRQGMLPGMVQLIRQIVQVMVRHSGTEESSFQLQQLLWALVATHSGQSVSACVTLSHEIARVIDALRQNEYAKNYSLTEMAEISRVSLETFRKRFAAELGLPPLSYLQFMKMEQAKKLLRSGYTVRQAGSAIGMTDPYHFSKQFKRVVGMSPTFYVRQAGRLSEATPKSHSGE